MTFLYLNYLIRVLMSKHSHILQYWGSGLRHRNLGRYYSAHNILPYLCLFNLVLPCLRTYPSFFLLLLMPLCLCLLPCLPYFSFKASLPRSSHTKGWSSLFRPTKMENSLPPEPAHSAASIAFHSSHTDLERPQVSQTKGAFPSNSDKIVSP